MLKPRPFLLAALLSTLVACHALAAAVPGPATDQEAVKREFMAALQRIRLRLPEPADSAALTHYPIYDYLLAARLQRDVQLKPGDDVDVAADAFLKAHEGQPVARNLRNDWLTSLANRGRWDWFLPRAADVNTPILICNRLAGRLATGATQGLAAEALTRWQQPKRQPAECDPVFSWLRAQGLLTAPLADARTRAALATNNAALAREFAMDVPAALAPPLLRWIQLLEAPEATLKTLALNPALAVEPDALTAGLNRLALRDSAAALRLLPELSARPDMTPALQTRLRRVVALGAAYGRDPGAVAAFDGLQLEPADNDAHEWRVRAALWAGDFPKALSWTAQMPPALAAQPRWRYWRARAVAATAGPEAAAPLFAEVADLRDFYGYLAADRLHRDYNLNARPSADVATVQATLAAAPGMIRARALFDCGLTDEAAAEWSAALSGADKDLKIQAAHLAARWGWYAQSIATLAEAGEWDDVHLRYPRPYTDAVTEVSKLTQLPPDWILAVMRQESLFRSNAVSRAGARGLMQLVPATAAAVAKRWHLPRPDREVPIDPTPDVILGAAYLSELLDRYGGQLGPSLAAYNAGPVPVARWLPGKALDADIWIENIPYGETRSYLTHIFEHIVAFAWVRNAPPPRLTALLPPIEPTYGISPTHIQPAVLHPSLPSSPTLSAR